MLQNNPALKAREMTSSRTKSTISAKPKPPQKHLTESEEQILLFQWAEAMKWKFPDLEYLHHIPNGGKRSKATAGRLKGEGVKAGVPDLCLPTARGGYHGMYIEMKAQGGTTTPAQDVWLQHLQAQGYHAIVCVGWERASEELVRYLALPPTRVMREEKQDETR